MGGRLKTEGMCVYFWLIHAVVQQKITQHRKAIKIHIFCIYIYIHTYIYIYISACSVASVVSELETKWTVAYQAPLSMGFSRHEYWSRLLCSLPGDLQWAFISFFEKYLWSAYNFAGFWPDVSQGM